MTQALYAIEKGTPGMLAERVTTIFGNILHGYARNVPDGETSKEGTTPTTIPAMCPVFYGQP